MNAKKTALVEEKPHRTIGGDSILVLLVGLSAILPFLLAPLRAQVLGPAGRGEFAFFQSALTTVGVISALGVRIACYQIGYLGERRFSISYTKMCWYSLLVASVVTVPLFFIAIAQFSVLVAWGIAALTILAPSFVINQIEFADANHTNNRLRIGNAASMPPLIEFAVSVVAFVLNQYSLLVGVLTAVGAQVARLITAWKWHLSDRSRVQADLQRPSRQIESQLFKASLKNAPAAVIPLLSGNLDVLILGVLVNKDVLGHYVIAKLGFTALLIAASVLEGRAIRLVKSHGAVTGFWLILSVSTALSAICGLAGFLLTPVIFGSSFEASAYAFPLMALAGGLAFMFVCVSAVNAQKRRSSFWPSLAILLALVAACTLLGQHFASNVVIISLALVFAQGFGAAVVSVQFFSRKGKHR